MTETTLDLCSDVEGAAHRPAAVSGSGRVIFNRPVGDAYWHVGVEAQPIHLNARPGQFFHILCPRTTSGEPFLRRPMSVYRTNPQIGTVEFLYKVTGIGTAGLASLRFGNQLDIFGPLGNGFKVDHSWSHALVVARGVGLATMGPLASELEVLGISISAILSFRSRLATIGIEPFLASGAEVETVYDSDRSSDMSNVAERIGRLHQKSPIDVIFTCGSTRLTRMLQGLQGEFAVPGQVAVEQRMGCAIGSCHACVLDFRGPGGIESRRVCCQGPVFNLEEFI